VGESRGGQVAGDHDVADHHLGRRPADGERLVRGVWDRPEGPLNGALGAGGRRCPGHGTGLSLSLGRGRGESGGADGVAGHRGGLTRGANRWGRRGRDEGVALGRLAAAAAHVWHDPEKKWQK